MNKTDEDGKKLNDLGPFVDRDEAGALHIQALRHVIAAAALAAGGQPLMSWCRRSG